MSHRFSDILEFVPGVNSVVNKSHPLYINAKNFLRTYYTDDKVGKPLCLSLSGGPDSMSQLYIFAELRSEFGFEIIAGHINYNNRDETTKEQLFAESECKSLRIECKTHIMSVRRVDLPRDKYETQTTRERFEFYKMLCQKHNAPVVVYGHHHDDISENVLTNFMKGRNVHDLAVMNEVGVKNGVTIWRPMLLKSGTPIWKSHVYEFLHQSNIPYLKDTTPDATKRGKMRRQVFPSLVETFGDTVPSQLVKMAREAEVWGDIIQDEIINPIIHDYVVFEEDRFKFRDWQILTEKRLTLVYEILGQLMSKMGLSRMTNKTVKEIHNRLIERSKTTVKPFERINPGKNIYGALTPTELIISTTAIIAPESKSARKKREKLEASEAKEVTILIY